MKLAVARTEDLREMAIIFPGNRSAITGIEPLEFGERDPYRTPPPASVPARAQTSPQLGAHIFASLPSEQRNALAEGQRLASAHPQGPNERPAAYRERLQALGHWEPVIEYLRAMETAIGNWHLQNPEEGE